MKTIDVKGLKCPMPLIQTKKALSEIAKDEALKIIIDNKESKTNVMRFLKDNGVEATLKEKGGIFEIIANMAEDDMELSKAEDYCATPSVEVEKDYVFVLAKNYIGEGSVELGKTLMGGFMEALLYQDERPSTIVFFNSGVLLALKDSPHLETFKGLEEMGIELLICGTCLKYYDKLDALGVGKVSNAYDILSSLTKAYKTINL